MNLTERNILILKLIIEEFLKTGKLIGSKQLLSKHNLGVSPATVRGDMAKLETFNFIYQPYNSAGRLPTSIGIRVYVDYIMKETPEYFLDDNVISLGKTINSFEDYIYSVIHSLAINSKELVFFAIPEFNVLQIKGIKNFISRNKQNFLEESLKIIENLEKKELFLNFIKNINLKKGINLIIGDENPLNDFKKFSIIIKTIKINDQKAYIGIIGNLKQDYNFNISLLKRAI